MKKLSKSWQRGFDEAQQASLKSNGHTYGSKMGASLFAGSSLLAIGWNIWGKTTRHSQHKHFNGNVHAEMKAIIKRQYYSNHNLVLYVVRNITNSKKTIVEYGCSKPCKKCMKLIKIFGIKKVRFFDEYGIAREIKL